MASVCLEPRPLPPYAGKKGIPHSSLPCQGFFREVENRSIDYEHGELIPGSKADQELEAIVRRAATLGKSDDPVIRWLPPGVRLKATMSPSELSLLEAEGIRRCCKCHEDPERKYKALPGGIKVVSHL